MKKKARKENKEQKGFVWYSLKISFALMVVLFLSSFFVNILALNLLFLISLLFNIIISIIHLLRHKRKVLAIVALIISTILAFFYIVGLFL